MGQMTRPGTVIQPSGYGEEGQGGYDFLSATWPRISPGQTGYQWTGPLELPGQIHGINNHMTHCKDTQKRLLSDWKPTPKYFWVPSSTL